MRRAAVTRSVPRSAFFAMCFGLAVTAALLLGQVAPWAVVAVLVGIATRVLIDACDWPLPSQAIKTIILAAGVGLTIAGNGALLGMEPGMEILLSLVCLKVLESRTARDYQVLCLLGFFLALCGLFFIQDIGRWFLEGGTALLLISALVRLHGGLTFGRSVRLAGAMCLQALPLIIVLHFIFPRAHGGLHFQLTPPQQTVTGMSDRMEPGSIASIANERERAFMVGFPDGDMPPFSEMYWRGVVLWKNDGLTWVRDPALSAETRSPERFGGPRIRQNIIIEPHGGTWLFALDRPVTGVIGAIYEAGGSIRSSQPITYPKMYDVVSRPENRETALPIDQLRDALQLPAHLSTEVQALARNWTRGSPTEREIVRRGLDFFRSGGFTYTLTPGGYGENGLDEFLFKRREGFCEHYAGAFATLMRVAKVPSRVVMGYFGGEFTGSHVEVSQSDCHAWCEVWIPKSGWMRVDPTIVIAPGRSSGGLETYLESASDAAKGHSAALERWRGLFSGARLLWNNVNYQWDLRILNYGIPQQQTFLGFIGMGSLMWNEQLLVLIPICLAAVGVIAFWLDRRRRPRLDLAARAFARFCRILARHGVIRQPWEGPLAFSERAADALPEKSELIRKAGALYIQTRFGPAAAPAEPFAKAVRELQRWKNGRSRQPDSAPGL